VNRILKSVIFIIAAVYIGVDAVFFTVAKPVADWVSKRRILEGLRAWVASLRPYPTLALFMVPLIALEPLKPVAAYLIATGHVRVALTTFVVGEILKLVILERLFAISRDKLMLIPHLVALIGGSVRSGIGLKQQTHGKQRAVGAKSRNTLSGAM